MGVEPMLTVETAAKALLRSSKWTNMMTQSKVLDNNPIRGRTKWLQRQVMR